MENISNQLWKKSKNKTTQKKNRITPTEKGSNSLVLTTNTEDFFREKKTH